MSQTFNPNLVDVLYKSLKNTFNDCDKDDIKQAITAICEKADITNLNEFIRTYVYKKYIDPSLLFSNDMFYEKISYMKFKYKHIGDLLGHSGQIDRLAFDHSSRFFFTGSSDGMIKMWDCISGFLVHSFIGHRSLVNDLCFSKDGTLMVSCDYFGSLNIWCLQTFKLILNIQLNNGVTFSEFFDVPSDTEDVYNLVIVLSTGNVKTYKFNKESVLEEKENDFNIDEVIKAICITDGGRFLLRGGYWPYLIVLDTINPDKCIILETNSLPVHTICAAKDCLKFAAACGNQLFQWTCFVEGNASHGNFLKSNNGLRGHWKRTLTHIEMGEGHFIERMCFLKDGYIVCVCTDLKIRIYAEYKLLYTINVTEIGLVCPHPIENIFSFCGSELKFYYFDRLIHSEKINFNINDCQFSSDGYFFVIGDDFGKSRVYSTSKLEYSCKEQFFISDFNHINSLNENTHTECINSHTVDTNRELNMSWKLTDYFTTKLSNKKNMIAEDIAIKHFSRVLLTKERYKNKYCIFTPSETVNYTEESEESSFSSTTSSYSSNSEFSDSDMRELSEKKTDSTSSEDIVVNRRILDLQVKRSNIYERNNQRITLRRTVDLNYNDNPSELPTTEYTIPLRRTFNQINNFEDNLRIESIGDNVISNINRREKRRSKLKRRYVSSSSEETSNEGPLLRRHLGNRYVSDDSQEDNTRTKSIFKLRKDYQSDNLRPKSGTMSDEDHM